MARWNFYYPPTENPHEYAPACLGQWWGHGVREQLNMRYTKCRKLTVGPPLMSLLVPLAVAERCGSSPRLFLSAGNADVDKTMENPVIKL